MERPNGAPSAPRSRGIPPDGPAAGGGVLFIPVEPGVPLGPGLLATCAVFHGPQARITIPSTKAATTAANVPPLILPSGFEDRAWLFSASVGLMASCFAGSRFTGTWCQGLRRRLGFGPCLVNRVSGNGNVQVSVRGTLSTTVQFLVREFSTT